VTGNTEKTVGPAYLAMIRACWRGRVDEVTAALAEWLNRQGVDTTHALADDDTGCP